MLLLPIFYIILVLCASSAHLVQSFMPRLARNARPGTADAGAGAGAAGAHPWAAHWVDACGTHHVPRVVVGASQVKIVSYNTLGPLHGEGSKHHYADSKVVRWSRRRDKLLAEMRSLDADFLCLQEVSGKALRETFMPGLQPSGLECVGYAPAKTGKAKGKYAHRLLGCAVFANTDKLEVLASKVHL